MKTERNGLDCDATPPVKTYHPSRFWRVVCEAADGTVHATRARSKDDAERLFDAHNARGCVSEVVPPGTTAAVDRGHSNPRRRADRRVASILSPRYWRVICRRDGGFRAERATSMAEAESIAAAHRSRTSPCWIIPPGEKVRIGLCPPPPEGCGKEGALLHLGGNVEACVSCARKAERSNPALMIVTGNPPSAVALERAWARFHQQDAFNGTTRNLGSIPGAPPMAFALGRLQSIDLGRGPQRLTGTRPWLVASAADDALWIVREKPMDWRGAGDSRVHALTYDPQASSGKEPAYYRHEFKRPLPILATVGAAATTRAVLLDGGRYRVDDWIYD